MGRNRQGYRMERFSNSSAFNSSSTFSMLRNAPPVASHGRTSCGCFVYEWREQGKRGDHCSRDDRSNCMPHARSMMDAKEKRGNINEDIHSQSTGLRHSGETLTEFIHQAGCVLSTSPATTYTFFCYCARCALPLLCDASWKAPSMSRLGLSIMEERWISSLAPHLAERSNPHR